MSHYLIEQLAGAAERRRPHGRASRSPPRARTATCARCASATPTAREAVEAVDACFVFIGAAPRTDWLEGVVARDERGFILAGADAKGAGWPLRARPLPARDERARRVRRRRRARALDQARGERGRRGLDGRLADPRVPGAGMSHRAAHRRRPAPRRPVRRPRRRAAGGVGGRGRAVRRRGRARSLVEPGEPPRGLLLLLEGTAADACCVDDGREEPLGHQEAPTWIGAIAALTERHARRAHARRDRRAAWRCIPRRRFTELALAQPAVHRRIMRQVGPVMTPAHRDRAEPRAARLARHDGGRARARAQQPGRRRQARRVRPRRRARDGQRRRSRAFVEAGIEREDAERLVAPAATRRSQRAADQHARSTRSTRPTPRTRCSSASRTSACPRPGGSPSRWRARRARRRVAARRSRALAGPATDAGAALGRRVADRAQRSPASCSTRPSGWARSSARSRPTPTWTAAASSRPTSTRGSRRTLVMLGHKLKHTRIAVVRDYDRALPKLTVRGSELNQVWTNLHRQRDRRARRPRHDHDPHARATATASQVDVADDGPGIPEDARAARPRAVLHDQGRRQRDRPRASTPRGGSSRRATAAASRSTRRDAGTTFHVRLPLRGDSR